MFDVYHAVQSYMNRIFADIVGMKILLVDHDTVRMPSDNDAEIIA